MSGTRIVYGGGDANQNSVVSQFQGNPGFTNTKGNAAFHFSLSKRDPLLRLSSFHKTPDSNAGENQNAPLPPLLFLYPAVPSQLTVSMIGVDIA